MFRVWGSGATGGGGGGSGGELFQIVNAGNKYFPVRLVGVLGGCVE